MHGVRVAGIPVQYQTISPFRLGQSPGLMVSLALLDQGAKGKGVRGRPIPTLPFFLATSLRSIHDSMSVQKEPI
jgi:hypothetical protein